MSIFPSGKKSESSKDKVVRESKLSVTGFIVFFCIFLGGYAFFFSSRAWIPNATSEETFTPIGQQTRWNNRTVTLLRWDYSEEQRLMEIEINIESSSFSDVSGFTYNAMLPSNEYLPTTVVMESNGWAVIQIEDVPKHWSAISLRITADGESGIVRFFTNPDVVDHVDQIELLTETQYQVLRYESLIESYNTQKDDLMASISDMEGQIEEIRAQIEELEAQKAYQTETEIEQTDQLIAQANEQIELLENNIVQAEESIAEIDGRIAEANDAIDRLEGRAGEQGS